MPSHPLPHPASLPASQSAVASSPREVVEPFPGLTLAGLHLPYNDRGDRAPSGAPDGAAENPRPRATLLCSHGWLDNAASFIPLWEALPACYEAWAYDLSGHGRSDHRKSPFEAYAPLDWVAEHASLAKRVAARAARGTPLVLVGHSMGAGVAALTAGVLGDSVAALVLIDGVSTLPGRSDDLAKKLRTFLKETEREQENAVFPDFEALVAARARGGVLTPEASRLLMGRGGEEVPAGAGSATATGGGAGAAGWRVRSDPRLKLTTPARLTGDQIAAVFSAITCPTILLRATRSHFDVYFEEMKGFIPHIVKFELRELDGGHHLHMDDPSPVAAEMVAFLERVLPLPAGSP